MKYKLLKDLPDLEAGAVFYWDDNEGQYTNDHRSQHAYLFTKGVVEDTEDEWFELITKTEKD